jgi:hypothetical protein
MRPWTEKAHRRMQRQATAASFELLDRPGWAKDSEHVFLRGHAISDDTAHFELLDGDLAKDSRVVYWSDGSVLSDDPAHFTTISDVDHYLHTKDSSVAHVNGNPISGADPATLQGLQGAYARDDGHAFYSISRSPMPTFRHSGHLKVPTPLIPRASIGWANQSTGRSDHGADPRTFPLGRAVTNCSDTSISFAE